MNIIICGAGEVGTHVAESLRSESANITVIDSDGARLRAIEDTMDVATYRDDCARADVLVNAGVRDADLVLAATNSDAVNVLTAAVAKGLGAAKTIARVHHIAFFEQRAFDYRSHLGIDRLICPEWSTAFEIAQTLRNPGALAIEGRARGKIEMQEFPVSRKAAAVGKTLVDLALTKGSRLAVITRKGESKIPGATTVIEPGDSVILVGNSDVFQDTRRLFHDEKRDRQRVVIMGGTEMAAWLARSLRDRNFAVRIFETNRERAEELAEEFPWATIVQADPTDRMVFDDEHLGDADVFVGMLDDDEANIISGAHASGRGVPKVFVVVKNVKFLDVLYDIGVQKHFSPREAAETEVKSLLDESPLRLLASLANEVIDVFRVRVGDDAPVIDRPLREVKLTPSWVVAAIERDRTAWVPSADDRIQRGDTVLVVGHHGEERKLEKLFAAK